MLLFFSVAVKKKAIDQRVTAHGRVNALKAFTLVEIMIVVAIIGVLAAVVIPSMVKARKQSQGRRIINDVRQLDAAINQWALEKNQSDGATIDTTEAASYLKRSWPSTDLLGNAYRIRTVGINQVAISGRTKRSLAGVGIDWGSY
jgi:prepilin-type N-terminal cleavage/methylation domain-containing protein